MRNYLIILLTLLLNIPSFSQTKDSIITKSIFKSEVLKFSSKIMTLERNNLNLQKVITKQKSKIDSLNIEIKNVQSNIQQIADTLHITIRKVTSVNNQTQGQIIVIKQSITQKTLYWILGILVLAILSSLSFLILRNRLASNTKNFDSQILKTNQTLQNEAIKLDSKLIEILQTQLSILKEERKVKAPNTNEADHKLPLKVGEEIHRMRKRIENMPQDIKGLSALMNSLQRLEEEFNDSGYEIEELQGKKYVDGMKIEARFVDNPYIPKGEEIITEVLRPQIKYKGVVIQVAKVEVGKS